MHVHVYTRTHTNVDMHVNVCGSTSRCGCVVDGNVVKAAL